MQSVRFLRPNPSIRKPIHPPLRESERQCTNSVQPQQHKAELNINNNLYYRMNYKNLTANLAFIIFITDNPTCCTILLTFCFACNLPVKIHEEIGT